MPDPNEQRHHARLTSGGEIVVKLAGSTEQLVGHCKTISGAGVSFVLPEALPLGKAAKIHVVKSPLGPPVTAFIEIVRCIPLTGRGFEIAAAIKSIKGC
ncbi:PilZ domain-containing protein [Methylomicrobium sp. RS1]|uniref:PilZ domain-containing protein n=1 Tax=Candidatus Methylomicrobium oryzae TaxID=2802053 RepID=UPI0019234D11|nr:PilZ domain-containing protein [Methylomicrobium sp. RS1]MBL1265631.1 PilZ domain-containing protein [Methylomicrobium sp. RS1]